MHPSFVTMIIGGICQLAGLPLLLAVVIRFRFCPRRFRYVVTSSVDSTLGGVYTVLGVSGPSAFVLIIMYGMFSPGDDTGDGQIPMSYMLGCINILSGIIGIALSVFVLTHEHAKARRAYYRKQGTPACTAPQPAAAASDTDDDSASDADDDGADELEQVPMVDIATGPGPGSDDDAEA